MSTSATEKDVQKIRRVLDVDMKAAVQIVRHKGRVFDVVKHKGERQMLAPKVRFEVRI